MAGLRFAATRAASAKNMRPPFVEGATVRLSDEPHVKFIRRSSSGARIGAVRVLIVEDDLRMAGLVHRGLAREGLSADVAATGEDALWMAEAHEYDAVVLDVMLPGINGFETSRRLRAGGNWAPILMLTARDGVADRVEGLDAGADDYLVKPFAFAELLARLRALARRGDQERPAVLAVGELRLDPAARRVWRGEEEV